MCGHRNGWMGRWVGGERGIFFHMTLCWRGQPLTPTLCLPSTDGLCLWLGWQFLPLLGILAFLPVMPPIPLPPAVSCPLRVSIFTDTRSLAWVPSFACLCIDIVLCQHLAISHASRFFWQYFLGGFIIEVLKNNNKREHYKNSDVVLQNSQFSFIYHMHSYYLSTKC